MKKKILLISDVKGWGGWVRAEYIKKNLSDEFDFDIIDGMEFNEWEKKTNKSYFSKSDIKKYVQHSKEKEFFDFDDFQRFLRHSKIRSEREYDLYYFLFHTMLVKKDVKRFHNSHHKAITIVTGYPTIKECFYGNRKNNTEEIAKTNFILLANKCQAIGANNLLSLKDLQGVYNKKTFYAPRGVDPDVFYPEKEEFEEKEKFVVAYVGKPVWQKGLNEYIRPACEIAGAELIVNDRNYTDALPPDAMRAFYNQADVYLVASVIDGTPNPALEAASCGRPVIANRIGNMPEFIKDGHNGFLVDMNINKYAYQLKQLKENRRRCFEMGVNARNEILKDWTWEKVTENERKIFREVL